MKHSANNSTNEDKAGVNEAESSGLVCVVGRLWVSLVSGGKAVA